LGVYARWFNFPPDGKTPQQAAGEGMIGHGSENAIIMYDLGTQPPQQQVGGPPEAFRRGDWYVEDIRRERRMRAGVVDDQP